MVETVRPPYRVRTPIKCAGPYTGAGDPKVKIDQWDEIGRDLYEGGYNQLSLFLILDTPLKFYPWPKVNQKYDFTRIDPAWAAHIFTMLERLAFWRITPKLKFVDQYHEAESERDAAMAKEDDNYIQVMGEQANWDDDPIVQGLGPDNAEKLYSSWAYNHYWWLQWDEPKPRQYTNFRAVNVFGRGMIRYVQAVVDAAKKVKELKNPNGTPKYPDFKLDIAWANETKAIFSAVGDHPTKTLGDRDEVIIWVEGLFKAAGFTKGKDLYVDIDYLAYRPDIRHVDYPTMASVSRDLQRHNRRLEIHGVKTIADIQNFTDAGVEWRSSLFSTDGDLRMIANYVALGHSPYHVDLKVDCKPGEPFFPTNFMAFWHRYFPKYKTYIKG